MTIGWPPRLEFPSFQHLNQDAPQFDGWSGGPSRTKSWGHTGRHFKHLFGTEMSTFPSGEIPAWYYRSTFHTGIQIWGFLGGRIEPLKVLTSAFCFPMALIPFGNQLHGWKIPKLWQICFDDFPISGFSHCKQAMPSPARAPVAAGCRDAGAS